ISWRKCSGFARSARNHSAYDANVDGLSDLAHGSVAEQAVRPGRMEGVDLVIIRAIHRAWARRSTAIASGAVGNEFIFAVGPRRPRDSAATFPLPRIVAFRAPRVLAYPHRLGEAVEHIVE